MFGLFWPGTIRVDVRETSSPIHGWQRARGGATMKVNDGTDDGANRDGLLKFASETKS